MGDPSNILEGSASMAQAGHNQAGHHIEETEVSLAPRNFDSSGSTSHLATASNTLENSLAALSITSNSPETMFQSLIAVFQASQTYDGQNVLDPMDGNNVWTILQRASEYETRGGHDVSALLYVRGVLDRMYGIGSRFLLPALKTVADASRDPSWRLPFGEAQILGFALVIITSHHVSDDIQVQCLRLIGNSCADTDNNRSRVITNRCLPSIMDKIGNPALCSVAIPVVYNISCDYPPAQQEILANGLYQRLVYVFERNLLNDSPALTYACRLLDLGLKELDPALSPSNAVEVLLRLAIQADVDVDDCASLVDTAIAHLQSESFQRHMILEEQFDLPLRLILHTFFPQADLSTSRMPSVSSQIPENREQDEEVELSRIRKSLITVLSDVSALPDFAAAHSSLDTQAIDTLIKWLSASLPHLQLCSCIILGNLAQSDGICEAMVVRLHIHKDLIRILKVSTDSQVIHSVLGFLRNLALPKENKRLIGEAGGIETLSKFLSSDSLPQVAHAAAALARQLVIANLNNIKRLLAPLSADEDSPAHLRTYLTLLLALFDKTDELAVKTEVARLLASLLRCAHSADPGDGLEKDALLQRLYTLHPNVAEPLGMMVSQSKYAAIRSEGWFAMALMARSIEGATAIQKTISEINIYAALEETIRGTKSTETSTIAPSADTSLNAGVVGHPEQAPPEMNAKDRENAMILINELLQKRDEDLMADIRRSALEELLQAGSQVTRQ